MAAMNISNASAADGPPVAPVRPVFDNYFGDKIADPYRYLENLADPQVKEWIKGQADYSRHFLSEIAGRNALLARIAELDEGEPYSIRVVRRWPNGDLHYLKRMAGENLDKLYFRDGKTGAERLLVDPHRFASGEKIHASLGFVRPSPDAKYIAYGIALSGSEQTSLHVFDMTSGNDLPDVIDRMEDGYLPPCWLEDGKSFVYSRRRKLAEGTAPTEEYQQTYACLHRLGTNADDDRVIFSKSASPEAPMSAEDFPAVAISVGSPYAIGQIKHGDSNELTLYVASIDTLASGAVKWKKICDVPDEVVGFAVHDDEIYLITAHGAPRYKVIRLSLDRPDITTAGNGCAARVGGRAKHLGRPRRAVCRVPRRRQFQAGASAFFGPGQTAND